VRPCLQILAKQRHQLRPAAQGVVGDGEQGAVAEVAQPAAPGVERPVHQAPGQAVRLLLGGAVPLHHAPQRQLDRVAVGGHRQLCRPVQVRDAADVAADGRGPLLGRAHGVDEIGDGL